MSSESPSSNRIRIYRQQCGWSQAELAERAGISRAAVSAMEIGRIVPSVTVALALADVLSVDVRELFQPGDATEPEWAWTPSSDTVRFWQAEVGGRVWRYPVEGLLAGVASHDGVWNDGHGRTDSAVHPHQTLVLASCDPAATLLAEQYHQQTPYRLLVIPRSSRAALTLLGEGRVHLAGVHLTGTPMEGAPVARVSHKEGNTEAIRGLLGPGYSVLHVARWQEGMALSPSVGSTTFRAALKQNLRWVGREAGSGARQCLDELFAGRPGPPHVARDHRGVAEAIRSGFADAGVCVHLAAAEAGLKFLGIRWEDYDLCLPTVLAQDPRVKALREIVRSPRYRQLLADLPGYELGDSGGMDVV